MAVIGEHGVVVSEVRVEASPETVFEFFTQGEKLQRWMGVAAEADERPGGAWRVDFNGRGSAAAGELVELDPPQRIVFTWGWEREDMPVPPGSSTVAIDLLPDGDGTIIRLTHSGLPPDSIEIHRVGWENYITRLATVGEGRDPGPDPFRTKPRGG